MGWKHQHYKTDSERITWGGDINTTIAWSALGSYHPLATQFIKRCKCEGDYEGKIIDKLDKTLLFTETYDKVDYVLDKCSVTEGFGN